MFFAKNKIQLNIRGRLTLQFALIVASILFLFSASVYTLSANYRKIEFYGRLKDKALTTAKLLIEVNEVDEKLLKIIDKNTVTTLPEENIRVYNYQNEEIYNSADEIKVDISTKTLDEIRLEKEIKFNQGEKEILGLLYSDNLNRFVVIASGHDKFGIAKIKNLRIVLLSGLLVSIVLTLAAGWIFSGRAMQPISRIVKEVDEISISNIGARLNEGNGKDEISQLAITFNNMLERLEESFELQRSFVSNASHEMRTPLTSITGQIEVALMKKQNTEEYEKILRSLMDDIRNLNRLTNGLLNLTQAGLDVSKLKILPVRIDELLWECEQDINKSNPDYKINIAFLGIEDAEESQLIVNGNEQLLKIALLNVIENACKYSPEKKANVSLKIDNNNIVLEIKDEGIGIAANELTKIFEPFYRGQNAKTYNGNGIGLSLTKKIVELHKGKITIDSVVNKGTTVTMVL